MVGFGLLVACQKAAPPPVSAFATKAEAAATPVGKAAPPSESPSTSDAWYPAGANQEVELTWALHPVLSDGEAGPERDLEVIARVGSAVRRVALGKQRGELVASQQSVCTPSLKTGETASVLTLATFGPRSFYAKRVQPNELEISYFVDAEPEERGVVAKIPIPADARIADAISDARTAGNERPFDCAGTGTKASPKVSPTAKRIDTSDWKSAPAGSTLSLRWTVDQSRARPPLPPRGSPDFTKFEVPVDLVMTLDGRSHSVSLPANAAAPASSTCGSVSFYWAGLDVSLSLRRAEDGRVVVTRGASHEYVLDVPRDVTVTQEIVTVDRAGKRTSTRTCKPTKL